MWRVSLRSFSSILGVALISHSIARRLPLFAVRNMAEFVRLPENALPKHYSLFLETDMKSSILGRVAVDLKVTEATPVLQLNAKDLDISEVTWDGVKAEVKYDEKMETATLSFPKPLPVGEQTVEMMFSGKLSEKLVGMYKSKYTSQEGKEKTMVVTQFEPTDARRCFPCWDEPALKATFSVTLKAPTGQNIISNMPEKSKKEDGDMQEVAFETTPVMSTYLLAFVIGEFDVVEATTKHDVRVRVFAPKGKSDQGKFALDVGVRSLDYFTNYFGIHYPLPKMDMLAIPDFAAGAMENWGCVTYREIAILVSEKETSAQRKEAVAVTVAHELAHQWFGNLVTMEWWTDLWLNEGFATWASYLAVDDMFPKWDVWTKFVHRDMGRAFSLDGLRSSHPIEVDVASPAQINEIFDSISYSKGSSVIRQLASYLGAEPFRVGLQKYLQKFLNKNASTRDLWSALEESTGKPVEAIMKSYTRQTGYPVVSVEQVSPTKVKCVCV